MKGMPKKPSKTGLYLAILASVFIGSSTIVAAQGTKQIPPVLFAALAFIASAVFLFILSLILKERLDFSRLFGKQTNGTLQTIWSRTVIANILLYTGFSMTSAVKAVFLMGLEPAFVAILGFIILKERLSLKQAGLIFLLFLGAFLLSTNADIASFKNAQLGDILIAGAMIFTAYSYFPSKKVLEKANPLTLTLFSNVVGGILLLLLGILLFNIAPVSLSLNAENLSLVIISSLLFSALGLFCFFTALKTTRPWVVSSLLQIAPVPGAIIAFLWLNDILAPAQLLGAAILLAGSFLIAREH